MKKKTLLTAILSIVMCLSLMAGATFALFTSESKVNIAITSGKVAIEASVSDVYLKDLNETTYTRSVLDGETVGFESNGTDTRTVKFDGQKLYLSNVACGDAVKFNVNINNNSTIAAKYRVIISAENNTGLFDGLVVNVDNQTFMGKTYTAWKLLNAGTNGDTVAFEITLPDTGNNAHDNKFQGKACDIVVTVEGIQGNADTFNDTASGKVVATVTDLDTTSTMYDNTISANGFTAEIPAGTVLEDNKTTLTFNVNKVDDPTLSNFTVDGVENLALEINIPEVDDANDKIIKIKLDSVLPIGLSTVNMLHSDVIMTAVSSLAEVDAHNEFYYDTTTGSLVIATTNFSEFVVVLDDLTINSVAGLNDAMAKGIDAVKIGKNIAVSETVAITSDIAIDGNANKVSRADGFTGTIFNVASGKTFTLENVVVDGGAIYSNLTNGVKADTVNTGIKATGSLVATTGKGNVILGENAILKNNDGASAVNLATRGGGTLTINGAQIINNSSAGGGAIWGGGNIIINSGKINGNYGGIGGAIRTVSNFGKITMNGGEMNYNTANEGGAIWGGNGTWGDWNFSKAIYEFNGGEMAYNKALADESSGKGGGAILAGTFERYTFSGDFEMHDNESASLGGAIRFKDTCVMTMNGGKIYNNNGSGEIGESIWGYNLSTDFTGGEIYHDKAGIGENDIYVWSGTSQSIGGIKLGGSIIYLLSTAHDTVNLKENFNFKYEVAENIDITLTYNFKPASDYVYTEGDEDKLVCMNEGYETYWDTATSTFRIRAVATND